MSGSSFTDLYRRSIVVDTTAPLAPFSAVQIAVGPEELVNAYSQAGVTFAIFTVVVDVTQVGLRSSLEALELTTKPPVFSHSTPKKFAPHDRNITDEQIRACAAKDGVICLSGVGLFLDPQNQRVSSSKLADTIEY